MCERVCERTLSRFGEVLHFLLREHSCGHHGVLCSHRRTAAASCENLRGTTA